MREEVAYPAPAKTSALRMITEQIMCFIRVQERPELDGVHGRQGASSTDLSKLPCCHKAVVRRWQASQSTSLTALPKKRRRLLPVEYLAIDYQGRVDGQEKALRTGPGVQTTSNTFAGSTPSYQACKLVHTLSRLPQKIRLRIRLLNCVACLCS